MTDTLRLRATPHVGGKTAIEDCYRNLVAAVILQAARWLRTDTARHYAELVDIPPDAVQALARRAR